MRARAALSSERLLKHELDRRGIVSKFESPGRGASRVGSRSHAERSTSCWPIPSTSARCRRRNERHSGQHEPIPERGLWERAQRRLRDGAARGQKTRTKAPRSPPAGKLFDEERKPLYVQGAAKGNRRYCYYVLRAPVRGTADQIGRGWRIPTREIELAVIGVAKRFLDDKAAVLTALQEFGIETLEFVDVLKLADDLSRRLASRD
jgi:site-specific DNA recombinase